MLHCPVRVLQEAQSPQAAQVSWQTPVELHLPLPPAQDVPNSATLLHFPVELLQSQQSGHVPHPSCSTKKGSMPEHQSLL